ncbi:hypothetical protein Tco_1275977, partial [Tanacetum coccineum]
MDREVKRLKQSRIPIIKVRWNSMRGLEFTWEREDRFRKKYPHLFIKTAPSTITLHDPYSAMTQFGGVTDWYLDPRLVMSSDNASSAVTYTSISSDSDGPSWAPLSPAYVPDPMEIEHHIPVYIPEPVYLEYHVPSDDDIQIENQPYAVDTSPSALSPGYIAESDPEEDPEEDSEEDLIDYAANTNDDEEDEEEEESSDDDEEEEEEHLSPAVALSAVGLVSSAEETKPFETDESAATPPPPPPAYRTTSRMSVRTQTHIPFPSEEEVARLFTLPTPPPSPLTLLSSPLPHIPSPPSHHPLPLPAPSTSRIADIPEAELPPRKRLLLTAPTP